MVDENNLYYNAAWIYGNGDGPLCGAISSGTCTMDYNASYEGAVLSAGQWQTSGTPATHDYNVSGSSPNPFSNYTAWTIAGFQLITPDPFVNHAGVALSSIGTYWNGTALVANTFNVDMNGNLFGANGTIDRGALQIGGTVAAPNPPTSLQVTSVQ